MTEPIACPSCGQVCVSQIEIEFIDENGYCLTCDKVPLMYTT